MKRLPVDLAELAFLLDQPRNGPVRAFFDRQSGELESMPRDAEVEGVFDDILSEPQRWAEITPLPHAQRCELRQRFVDEEVTDAHQRLRLLDALDGAQPFTRFEAVLRERPAAGATGSTTIDAWFAYRERALATLAAAWLSALGVEPKGAASDDGGRGGAQGGSGVLD